MAKLSHEVRDAIHGFILFNTLERSLIDSEPMQRLRCIHQLSMCYQVYPGATHKRFEHSLGVMEVSSRIFDRLFNGRLSDAINSRIAEDMTDERKNYWRRVIRIAGLLHDIGHLPFSHAAEAELLPEGWNHERITAEIIRHSEISEILRADRPQIDPEDVIDILWDPEKRLKAEPKILSPWKTLLNEIICGNTFGADRIDYLLRDSLHAGVAYGRFDPDRLISGLTTLIDPENGEISLGLEIGAIHAAEALLLARYFMYTQVYFHDVRRAYDLHLKEFLKQWLPGGTFSTNWKDILKITDHEVISALRSVQSDCSSSLHECSVRLLSRRHFRTVYDLVSTHKKKRPSIFDDLLKETESQFNKENIRFDNYGPKSETNDFWVKTEVDDRDVDSSLKFSGVIANLPPVEIGLIFASPQISNQVKPWIDSKLKELIKLN